MNRSPYINVDLVTDVAACLGNGGVALLPTDTVYGLAASPTASRAVDKLYALKARPYAKSLPIMISNQDQLGDLGVRVNDRVELLLASNLVPGALSIVASLDREKCPSWLSGRDEVAFRMPNDRFLLDVLDQTGPLLVTSANLHGNPTAADAEKIQLQLNGEPDIVVEGEVKSDIPSTLVNCREYPVVIERQGAVPAAKISKLMLVKDG